MRADLVETAQKTLEGEAGKEELETNVQQLVSTKTQELQVNICSHFCIGTLKVQRLYWV